MAIEANQKFTRFMNVSEDQTDLESRTVALTFSSETPYLREINGMLFDEVLDHSETSVDLGHLKDGAPLLLNHNTDDQIGAVQSVQLKNKKGLASVRFSKSARASEVLQDVRDKIRTKVSVGYLVLEYSIEQGAGRQGHDLMRVTKWQPIEISIVAIPADPSVGIGRNQKNSKEKKIMTELTRSEQSTNDRERNRVDDLQKLGEALNEQSLARSMILDGRSAEDLRVAVLDKRNHEKPIQYELKSYDLPGKEKKEYSIVNVLRSLAGDPSVDIGYEREHNQEIQRQRGTSSKGFSVPMSELSKRSAITAGGTGASLVEAVYQPNLMVEFLRNKSTVINAGATSIQVGNSGDLIIPRQTGSATATWLDLDGTDTITESNQTFDQIELNMKTLTAMTTYSHRMLKQGLPNIETIILNDLAALFAVEVDKTAIQGVAGNAKIPTGILNQTGVGSVTAVGALPTFAELVSMEGIIADANIDTMGLTYLTTPTLGTTLKTVEKAANTGQFIWTDSGQGEGMINGYKAMYTKNMPTGTVLLGQFSDLLMGYWGSIDLQVDPYGANFAKGNISVRAMLDMDINVRRPDSFCKLAVTV